MTYKDAADRIERHICVNQNDKHLNDVKVVEALRVAVNVLRKLSLAEECVIQKGCCGQAFL